MVSRPVRICSTGLTKALSNARMRPAASKSSTGLPNHGSITLKPGMSSTVRKIAAKFTRIRINNERHSMRAS